MRAHACDNPSAHFPASPQQLHKVLWMQFLLSNISVAQKIDKEGKEVLVVYMPGGQRRDRQIMTPDDAKMVLELVKVRFSCCSQGAPLF